jgi:hypothetical protein
MSTNEGENKVIKHGKKLIVTVGAVSALAFGGAALANGGSTPVKTAAQPPVEQKSGPDRDKVQSGDQSTPDTPGSAEQPETPGSVEQPETSGETGSEVANDDGPGGHADEPGNANADHQFNGQE